MGTRGKYLPEFAEPGRCAIHKVETTKITVLTGREDFYPESLAAEAKRASGSTAPTVAAWNAFAAWCEATDYRYRAWATAYKLLTRRTPAGL